MKNTTTIKHYKGHFINRIFPSGYYEVYLENRFIKADTLQGIKEEIKNFLKTKK